MHDRYLDLAANDAKIGSNSYFFDRCLGWRGICIEANPKYHPGIQATRNCDLIKNCVSDREGAKVNFKFAGVCDVPC